MALRAVAGPRPGTLPGASGTGASGTQAQKHVSRQRDKVQPRQTAPGNPSGRPHAPAGVDGRSGDRQPDSSGQSGGRGGWPVLAPLHTKLLQGQLEIISSHSFTAQYMYESSADVDRSAVAACHVCVFYLCVFTVLFVQL